MTPLTLSPAQIAALEADRLKLIVVPLDPQPPPGAQFRGIYAPGLSAVFGDPENPKEDDYSHRLPSLKQRIGSGVVTDVKVKRVQDVTGTHALHTEIEPDLECCGCPIIDCDFTDHGEPINPREECCGNPVIVTDPRATFRDHFNSLHPDAWDRNDWCAFVTIERKDQPHE